ncbi:MAG TPA: gamma-glutamyl-gamma-aminobutyrate hydrolase family protein [Abditibacteriaceae bacterium]|jgi:putative glutamine amidotransferase
MSARIGITCSNPAWPESEAGQNRLLHYRKALEEAGAEGEFLFLNENTPEDAARLATQLDGLLISGGADLNPELYGEALLSDASVELVNAARPALEWALADEFSGHGKPILGICYGCQFLNVWAGGGLLQDIELQWPQAKGPQAVAHRAATTGNPETRHAICIAPDSALAHILETDNAEVNSYHHQGIAQAAPGNKVPARAVAQTADGIIEAVELGALQKGEWILGVQWHPERDRESPVTQRLFASFVNACL